MAFILGEILFSASVAACNDLAAWLQVAHRWLQSASVAAAKDLRKRPITEPCIDIGMSMSSIALISIAKACASAGLLDVDVDLGDPMAAAGSTKEMALFTFSSGGSANAESHCARDSQ